MTGPDQAPPPGAGGRERPAPDTLVGSPPLGERLIERGMLVCALLTVLTTVGILVTLAVLVTMRPLIC